jgi:hypothetical protein
LRRGNFPEKEILEFLGVRVKLNFPGFVDRNPSGYYAFHRPTPERIERQNTSIARPKRTQVPKTMKQRPVLEINLMLEPPGPFF